MKILRWILLSVALPAALWASMSLSADAMPPVLTIDSLPVAATCTAATPTGRAGSAKGEALLRAAPAPSLGTEARSAGDLYQSTIELADWGGHFARYTLPAGGGVSASSTLVWDAGAILTGTAARPPTPAPERRHIYTAVVQPDGALTMTPFAWSTLSPAQQTLLNAGDLGEQRVAYLRGDRTQEGTKFRRRSSVLGDAVHSAPVYVGPVERRAAVYLGVNDGMLHAFDASSGIELFAYVPDALIAQLHHLSNSSYVHRAYVDGPASVGEATIDGSSKTILLQAMGGGAQGMFALDVSDPANFADGLGVLWEFTDRDDPLMGNVTTKPQIAKVRLRKGFYRQFAIIASGINNYADDGRASDGQGALFLLALDKPRDQGWKLNTNYYRITTPIADSTLANALSAPVLLNDSDGAIRYAYAGDLQGNLWRFDFSDSAPWSSDARTRLFVARDASGRRQPISQQPSLAYAQSPGYMVLFGTGRLIEQADRSSTSAPQSYYAILDSLQAPPDIITSRSQLTQRFLDGSDLRMEASSKGWYVDFTEPAERSISSSVLVDGAVLFNTILPGADTCSATRSRSYVLNALTGRPDDGEFTVILPSSEAITGVMLPDFTPSPLLLPQSISHSAADPQGRIRQEKRYALVRADGTGALTSSGAIAASKRVGRLSWREIANWRELHEAAK